MEWQLLPRRRSVTLLLVAPLPKLWPEIDGLFLIHEALVFIVQEIVFEAEGPDIMLQRQMVSDVCGFPKFSGGQVHVDLRKKGLGNAMAAYKLARFDW